MNNTTPNTTKIVIGLLVVIILCLALYITSKPRIITGPNTDGSSMGDMMNGDRTNNNGTSAGNTSGATGNNSNGTNGPVTPMTPDKTPLGSTVWIWNNTTFTNKAATVSSNSDKFVIRFEEGGKVTSLTDCNSLSGTYALNIKTNLLKFGPLAATKMACTGASLETSYSNYLSQVDSYVISENHLYLNLANNAGTMTFTRKLR